MCWDAMALWLALLVGVIALSVCLAHALAWKRKRSFPLANLHVFITGGSQGLGKALAREAAQQAALVTIVARKENLLNVAKCDIEREVPGCHVLTISADVTDESALREAVEKAQERHGPVDILVPCAGYAPTGYIHEQTPQDASRVTSVNLLGTINAVMSVLPDMTKRRKGRIVIVSSAASMIGRVGYVLYGTTKWALRGFAINLRHELLPYGIQVHSAYPPGMDTPGFQVEEKTKPQECKDVEASETVYSPSQVAKSIWTSVRQQEFHISCGDFGVDLLTRMSSPMTPRGNLLLDVAILPLLALIARFVQWDWDRSVCSSKYDKLKFPRS